MFQIGVEDQPTHLAMCDTIAAMQQMEAGLGKTTNVKLVMGMQYQLGIIAANTMNIDADQEELENELLGLLAMGLIYLKGTRANVAKANH